MRLPSTATAEMAPDPQAPPAETPAKEPAAPPAPETEVDFLTAPIDDPIFKAEEPYKGLPHETDILAGLTEDAKKRLHNTRLGAQKAAAAAKAAEERAAALEAEVAKLKAAPAPVAPTAAPTAEGAQSAALLQNQRVRRLLGYEEGDFLDGADLPTDPMADFDIEKAVPEFADDFFDDPKKARAALLAPFRELAERAGKVKDYARTVAAKAAVEAVRATTLPYLEQERARTAKSQETAYVTAVAEWRKTTPGMQDDANATAVLDLAQELGFKVDHAGAQDVKDAYAVWAARNPEKVKVATPAPSTPAPPPPPPKPAPAADPMEMFRRVAAESQGKGTRAGTEAPTTMPKDIANGPMEGKLAWLAKHPEARAALRSGGLAGGRAVLG